MKYIITRTDGRPIKPTERYFVLRLDNEHADDHRAAIAAINTYIKLTKGVAPAKYAAALRLISDPQSKAWL